MNGWMDARQGNPVRTPARATLAGATDDDACMVCSRCSLACMGTRLQLCSVADAPCGDQTTTIRNEMLCSNLTIARTTTKQMKK